MEEWTPLTVLIIGPSQNGKSTFVNRLISLAIHQAPLAKEGDGNFKCTSECQIYNIEVPLTDYKLIDLRDRREYDVPDWEHEEDKIVANGWWKKQTRSKYAILPRKPDGPRIRLRLIDTPGLDDSEGKDFENMSNVLATLNNLSKSELAWQRQVNAVILVYNSNSAFSYSFQNIIRDYERCMPNLFGGLSVVNTNFSISHLAQKRQHLLRDKILGDATENARSRIIKDRRIDFSKIFGGKHNPTHFFIDNVPKSNYAYDEYVSCNTISDILNFWAGSKPMPISQMHLIKNASMQAIDKKLQSYLYFAIEQWEVERNDTATEREALRGIIEQRHQELQDQETRIQSELDRYDNDTEYTIQKYTTSDDPSAIGLFSRWVIRKRIKNSMTISEPDYEDYKVEPTDGINDRWTSHQFDYSSNSWTGHYEANPGKVPRLVARSYTTNRVYHADTISRLRSELRRTRDNLVENQAKRDKYASEGELDQNPKLKQLVKQITEGKSLVEFLRQESPSLDQGFDAAARSRYGKIVSAVGEDDLLRTVKALKPDLERPLKVALAARE